MSYTDQKKMSGGKIGSIVVVALLHIVLGYALVTGLALNYVKKAQEKLKTFDVEEPPPPPPDVPPPPPPPDQKFTPPPVVVPPAQVQIQRPSAPVFVPSPPQPPAPVTPPPPPAPPRPPAISQAAQSKGNPSSWFTNDDYPPGALRANAAGRVTARLTIGTDGRVSGCSVTGSSGNDDLDSATCRIAQRRGRYTAAKDENGAPTVSGSTINIRWVVPKD